MALPSAAAFRVGECSFLKLHVPVEEKTSRMRHRYVFVLDNSGSMGGRPDNSEVAKSTFADLIKANTSPSALIIFDDSAMCLSNCLTTAKQMKDLPLPTKGRTNISAGLHLATTNIIDYERSSNEKTLHILILLSDGGHNCGPQPSSEIPKLRSAIRSSIPNAMIATVAIGVTRYSTTSVGSVLKTQLETLQVGTMEQYYFCPEMQDMTSTIQSMSKCIHEALEGQIVKVDTRKGSIVYNIACPSESIEYYMTPSLPSPQNASKSARRSCFNLLRVGETSGENGDDIIKINGHDVVVDEMPFSANIAIATLRDLINQIRQLIVAKSSSTAGCIASMKIWIDALEKTVTVSDIDLSRTSCHDRFKYFKAVKAATAVFRELRNELARVEAYQSDDSADQAAFLTGHDKKFAKKTLLRSSRRANVDNSEQDPALTPLDKLKNDILETAKKVKLSLRMDSLLYISRMVKTENFKDLIVSRCERSSYPNSMDKVVTIVSNVNCCNQQNSIVDAIHELLKLDIGVHFLDDIAPDIVKEHSQAAQSWLSLLTQHEQLSEWIEFSSGGIDDSLNNVSEEYLALTSIGMLCYPIRLRHTDAAQANPFATAMLEMLPCPVDSCSFYLSLKCNNVMKTPEGRELSTNWDVLMLIDPLCPNSSLNTANSMMLGEICTSITLGRDLFMYTGMEQRYALHAHALCFLVQERGAHGGNFLNPSNISLCLKVIYSIRKLWGDFGTGVDGKYPQMLSQLFNWDCLNEASGVLSTSQLVLALTCLDWPISDDEDGVGETANWRISAGLLVPLMNLFNEHLSRQARAYLRNKAGNADNSQTMHLAQELMCQLLGIGSENSPQAGPLAEPEPNIESIMESTSKDYLLRGPVQEGLLTEYSSNEDVVDAVRFVTSGLEGINKSLHFARLMRKLVMANGGWERFMFLMETQQIESDFVSPLAEFMKKVPSVQHVLDIHDDNKVRIYTTMAAQAFLCHVGSNRDGSLENVLESSTLENIAFNLRLYQYKISVRKKMKAWSSVAENVTYQSVVNLSAVEFGTYIKNRGRHAHGMSSSEFWACVRAMAGDSDKEQQFFELSNSCFKVWYEEHKGSFV